MSAAPPGVHPARRSRKESLSSRIPAILPEKPGPRYSPGEPGRPAMRIWMTLVLDEDEQPHSISTIEHEGKFWLVLSWIAPHGKGVRIPVRAICLDDLPHIEVD